MGKKVVTEAQAWAILAKYYGNNPKLQYICFLLEDIDWMDVHSDSTWCHDPMVTQGYRENWPVKAMMHRIYCHQEYTDFTSNRHTLDDADGRPFPRNDARVIFCTLMALECNDEKAV